MVSAHTCQILGSAWLGFLAEDEEMREAVREQLPDMEPNVRRCYEEFFKAYDSGRF